MIKLHQEVQHYQSIFQTRKKGFISQLVFYLSVSLLLQFFSQLNTILTLINLYYYKAHHSNQCINKHQKIWYVATANQKLTFLPTENRLTGGTYLFLKYFRSWTWWSQAKTKTSHSKGCVLNP